MLYPLAPLTRIPPQEERMRITKPSTARRTGPIATATGLFVAIEPPTPATRTTSTTGSRQRIHPPSAEPAPESAAEAPCGNTSRAERASGTSEQPSGGDSTSHRLTRLRAAHRAHGPYGVLDAVTTVDGRADRSSVPAPRDAALLALVPGGNAARAAHPWHSASRP